MSKIALRKIFSDPLRGEMAGTPRTPQKKQKTAFQQPAFQKAVLAQRNPT